MSKMTIATTGLLGTNSVASSHNSTEYSIAAVSKLTGMSCHALRVWERRYGYPAPHRTGSNQRRYTSEEVRVLERLADLVRSGRSIGELIAELKAGRLDLKILTESEPRDAAHPDATALVDYLLAGDLVSVDSIFNRLDVELSRQDVLARVFEPAMIEIGERWFQGKAAVFQEHFATGVLLRRLGRMLQDSRAENTQPAYRAIVASVQGDRHEGGTLILSTMLELSGWRAISLGVDLPVSELRKAVEAWRPDAVGVSFVLSRNVNKRFEELATIRGTPIFIGGRSLMNHQALARRHGLCPLTGPLMTALPLWLDEFHRWQSGRASEDRPSSV